MEMNGRIIDGILIDEYTSAPLRATKSAHLLASPTEVFQAVSDHEHLWEIVPGVERVETDSSKSESGNGKGTIRYMHLANGKIQQEEIVHWDAPHAYGYAAIEANQLGFRNHLGLVTCVADNEGYTRLRWSQYFDHDDVSAMTERMEKGLGGIVQNLIDRFGGTVTDANNI